MNTIINTGLNSKEIYIKSLEEKIEKLEANRRLLLQIIEILDQMLKANLNNQEFTMPPVN